MELDITDMTHRDNITARHDRHDTQSTMINTVTDIQHWYTASIETCELNRIAWS